MEMGQKRTAEPSFSSPGGWFYPCSSRHQRQKNHPVFNTITVNIIAICAFQLRESLPESILTASILPITFFSPSLSHPSCPSTLTHTVTSHLRPPYSVLFQRFPGRPTLQLLSRLRGSLISDPLALSHFLINTAIDMSLLFAHTLGPQSRLPFFS